jgi:DNA-binding CsgD family transcriptional regulator
LAVAEDDAILASSGAAHSTALMLEARGRARQVAGRTADAVSDLRAAGEIFDGLGLHNPNATSWRSALALMLRNSQREEALCLIGDELEDALRIGNPRAIGVALRARGIAIGGSDGRADLEEAVAVLKASPARLEYARALVALGSHMRRTGARSAARERLRAGLDIAVATGAERLAEHAHAELEASGARLRRERITGRDALTPSELRVANLAAEGLTNAEIAQALFVTPKTVDTHLSHAYSKLGIGTRRDLGAALEQRREEVALATHGAPG